MNQLTDMEVREKNAVLEAISLEMFGDAATLRIVDPRGLRLRPRNARYMKKETFRQLVANLREDARLSSVPLCCEAGDALEILSGNHRVKAAMEAGLPWVLVMVLLGEMSDSRQVAVQLSHNALCGQDDPQILADLWSRIADIRERLYAGLDSAAVKELETIKLVQFATPAAATRAVTFLFTVAELERVREVVAELSRVQAGQEMYLAEMEQYARFFEALQAVKKQENVKNASLAMLRLLDLANRALEGQP